MRRFQIKQWDDISTGWRNFKHLNKDVKLISNLDKHKLNAHLDVMILWAGCDVISVPRTVPRRHAHHSRLMSTCQLSNTRKHSQVPKANFVARSRVQIAWCGSQLQSCNWTFSRWHWRQCCCATQCDTRRTKSFNRTDIWLTQIPSSNKSARSWEKDFRRFIILNAYNWTRMGWKTD